jgi:hypothetical protein
MPGEPPYRGELLGVDEEDVLEVEEDRVDHFASFRRVAS